MAQLFSSLITLFCYVLHMNIHILNKAIDIMQQRHSLLHLVQFLISLYVCFRFLYLSILYDLYKRIFAQFLEVYS